MLATVPLLGAAAYGFHDPFHTEDTGPNLSVTHGLVLQDFVIQFNLSVTNHADDAGPVELTLDLPELGPIPNANENGGWDVVDDAGAACDFPSDALFRCRWDTFPSHDERTVFLRGDASCLCGTFEMDFRVGTEGDVDEQDNRQVILLDWPRTTPSGLMGTTVTPSVDGDHARIDIEVRNQDSWPMLFGVEVYSDLPIVEGGWTLTEKATEQTGPSSCMVHLNEDLFCDVSPIGGMGSLAVTLAAEAKHACGTHPFQVIFTSDGNAPRAVDSVLAFADCAAKGAEPGLAPMTTSSVGEGRGQYQVLVRNDGPDDAANVRITAQFPDFARPWSFDDLDHQFCVVEDRAVVECVYPSIGLNEEVSFLGWTLLEGWCGEDVVNNVTVSADNAPDPVTVTSPMEIEDCAEGDVSDAALTAHAHHGRDTVLITYNVTAVGDAPSEEVTIHTTLPHLGGVRWVVHGEDREYCALTFNDLDCDFGTLPAGVQRQVWVKAWQHHDDCGFDVVHTYLSAAGDDGTEGNNHAAATIVPPWKLHEERHGG